VSPAPNGSRRRPHVFGGLAVSGEARRLILVAVVRTDDRRPHPGRCCYNVLLRVGDGSM